MRKVTQTLLVIALFVACDDAMQLVMLRQETPETECWRLGRHGGHFECRVTQSGEVLTHRIIHMEDL